MAFVVIDGKRADLAIRGKANVHFNVSLFTVELVVITHRGASFSFFRLFLRWFNLDFLHQIGVYGSIILRFVLVVNYKFTKIFSKSS